jgi:hypothetical protein
MLVLSCMEFIMELVPTNHEVYFTSDSKPYGFTYGQWTVRWWQWAHSIPKPNNPVADHTGVNAGINQGGPVWFLAGTFGENTVARRSCSIPSGRALLFPVINYEMNKLEDPHFRTGPELITHVKEDIDDIVVKEVFVDGKKLPAFRIRSDPAIFELFVAEDNCMNIKGGYTHAAADGFWVFLKPMEQGRHTIYFHGACSGGMRNAAAEYHLTINDL